MPTRTAAAENDHVDGNALAGPLATIFAADVTVARTTCVGCGRNSYVAELHVYPNGPGMTGRCPGCSQPVIRYTETPRGFMLDLRGTVALLVTPQDDAGRNG